MSTPSRYAVGHTASTNGKAAVLKSLKSAGPLSLAVDHMAVVLMPDAFEDDSRLGKETSCAVLNGLCIAGLSFHPDVGKGGMHFAVSMERWAKLFKDIDQSGAMDMTPIHGSAEVVMPIAAQRVFDVVVALPPAQRELGVADVLYEGSADNAGTDTWFDHLTPYSLARGIGSNEAVAQFMNLARGTYNSESTGGRAGDEFENFTTLFESSVGRSLDGLSNASICAAVVAWFKRTRPPPGFRVVACEDDARDTEVERRAGATESIRFCPLFEGGWRPAYPQLKSLWPSAVADIIARTVALASGLDVGGLGDGLTPSVVIATCDALQDVLPFANRVSNEHRAADVVAAHRRRRDAPSNDGGPLELSVDAQSQLQQHPDFIQLKTDVSACGSTDYAKMAKVMMQAKHPAGILFLNNKFAPDRFWKERAASRTESTLQAVFTEALSYDTAGVLRDWGSFLLAGTAKTFVGGKFNCDWWRLIAPVVAKREGRVVVDSINARVRSQPSKSFWSDPERLRIAEGPARTCMELVRMGGSGTMSFPAAYRMIMRLATAIYHMPPRCAHAKGFRNRLEEVAVLIMQDAEERTDTVLATPATAATRVASFVFDGQALKSLHNLDARVGRILEEIDDGMHQMARDPANNWHADGEYEQQLSKKQRRALEQDWQPQQSADANGVVWGSAAVNGIWTEPDGKRIAFGKVIGTFETAPDLKNNCPACYATGKGRDKWCPTPRDCWASGREHAHTRPSGFTDEMCKGVDAGNVDGLDWSTFTSVVVPPSSSSNGGGGMGGGKGGKGAGGKGGKGAGKGGGKGGKGGKGGAKGKGGKGKGGKGGKGQHFGRL